MATPKSYQFDTLSLHAGQQPDPEHGARAQPIYFTTSYVFKDTDQAASLFNMERGGHVYSRITNPTNAVLEERVSALEGGVGAIATASGQAALHLAIATLMGAGSHIVASRSLYGGSHNLLHYTLPRFGTSSTVTRARVMPFAPDLSLRPLRLCGSTRFCLSPWSPCLRGSNRFNKKLRAQRSARWPPRARRGSTPASRRG